MEVKDEKPAALPPAPEEPKRKYYIQRSVTDMTGQHADRWDKLTAEQRALQAKRTMDIIWTWPNWEIWPFKLGSPIVGFAALVPGFILNNAFRSALLLGHYGRTSSYMMTMGFPSAICGLVHNLAITTDILEQKTSCPVCLQVRSASIQLAVGFVYPLILAPVSSFMIGSGIKNLYMPKIHKEPKEVFKFARDIMKPITNRYLAAGALQIVVAMGVTYFEQDCFNKTLWPILTDKYKFNKETRKRNLYDN